MSLRSVTVNAGMSGSGKSSLGIRYLLNAPLSYRFLFDPDPGERNLTLGEFADRLKLPPARDQAELAENLCRGWIAFDPWTLFPGKVEEAFDWFCRWTFEVCGRLPGDKLLVVDEVWKYCSPVSIPFWLTRVVKEGRKRGLRLMVNIQEPHRLSGRISAEMSELICFRLQLPRALEWLGPFDVEAQEVARLAPLQFVARNLDSGGMLRGRVRF